MDEICKLPYRNFITYNGIIFADRLIPILNINNNNSELVFKKINNVQSQIVF